MRVLAAAASALATLVLVAGVLVLAPNQPAQASAGPPPGSQCVFNYGYQAYANVCTYTGRGILLSTQCAYFIGTSCVPIVQIGDAGPGTLPVGGVYADVLCNQESAGIQCSCHAEHPGVILDVKVCAPVFV